MTSVAVKTSDRVVSGRVSPIPEPVQNDQFLQGERHSGDGLCTVWQARQYRPLHSARRTLAAGRSETEGNSAATWQDCGTSHTALSGEYP